MKHHIYAYYVQNKRTWKNSKFSLTIQLHFFFFSESEL